MFQEAETQIMKTVEHMKLFKSMNKINNFMESQPNIWHLKLLG